MTQDNPADDQPASSIHEPPTPAAGDPTTPHAAPQHASADHTPGAHTPPGSAPHSTSYPPPYLASRRLYRSTNDRKISGVSGGIAECLDLDPTLVRLVILFLAFGTGVGVLVYLAAWAIVPERPDGPTPAPGTRPRANQQTITVIAGLGALTVAVGIITGSWVGVALALIAGGVWLLSEQRGQPIGHSVLAGAGPPHSSYVPATPTPTQDLGWPSASSVAGASFETFAPPPPTEGGWQPTRIRKPQKVTRVVLSLLALVAAGAIAATAGDWWDFGTTRYLGVAVIIIGVGVVVGQLRGGGARGLIPLGLLAAFALVPVSAVDGLVDRGVGDSDFRPVTLADLDDQYHHGIGKLTVDLSDLDLGDLSGDRQVVDIELGIGRVEVIVPPSLGGIAEVDAGIGEISHDLGSSSARFEDGVGVESGRLILQGDEGALELRIHVGIGSAALRSTDES